MYEKIKRIDDKSFDYKGKSLFMRCDFNVPQKESTREITSDKRIRAALPSINYALKAGVKRLILVSHLGKPKKYHENNKEYHAALSLDKVAKRLSELLGKDVIIAKDYLKKTIPEKGIILLENIRFYFDQEQSKDEKIREEFARRLAGFTDIYINEAFGTCHRKEASVYDIVKMFPQKSGIGFLVDKEIKQLSRLIENQKKPYITILGGAKVEDKIKVIKALSEKVDKIIIVGAMEYAFEAAKGQQIGDSLCIGVDVAKKAINSSFGKKILLPVDSVIAKEILHKKGKKKWSTYEAINDSIDAGNIPKGYKGLDIGQNTIKIIINACSKAKTIFWNGPAGRFEISPFDNGTNAIARYLASLPEDTIRIVGGGDSVAAIEQLGLENKFTHISTGGGASLKFLENNGRLPCLEIQKND